MKVEILQKNRKIKGAVGEIVEVPATLGNWLSCVGVVRVVAHDPPGDKKCVVRSNPDVELIEDDDDQE